MATRRGNPVRRGGLIRVMAVLAVMLAGAAVAETRIRPAVESMIGYQARVAATRVVNESMSELLERDGAAYDEMVRISRGPAGEVTALETNVAAVNRLKARLAAVVVSRLEDRLGDSLSVPLGTLVGGNLLSGRGPRVNIKLIPIGYVQLELYNEFVSAGINQTLHRVMIRSNVRTVAVLPGFRVETETTADFCVAETVVVGAVPGSFTLVNGDDRAAISKVNDYGG